MTNETTAPELKPCPFCDGANAYKTGPSDNPFVICPDCGCCGPAEYSALEWNSRADALAAAQARIAELERENAIIRAAKSGVTYVCPECDIAGCKHVRAALEDKR